MGERYDDVFRGELDRFKLVRILKASAWQLLGLSLGPIVFWLLFQFEFLPPTENLWIIYGLPLAFLVTAGLAVTSLLERVAVWMMEILRKRRQETDRLKKIVQHQKQFIDHLQFLTENERGIYGWLLTKNQKSFTAEMDGGHGSSLLKRVFIKSDVIGGLFYGSNEFPFSVPDHIWTVLEENRDQFPTEFKERKRPWFRSGY